MKQNEICDYSGDDNPVDYQTGRTAGVFAVGETIEKLSDASTEASKHAIAVRDAMNVMIQKLLDYRVRLGNEHRAGRLKLKEGEYALKYVGECINMMQTVSNEANVVSLKSQGAAQALLEAVKSVKKMYDVERIRLKEFEDWRDSDVKDPKQRPVGYPPKDVQKQLRDEVAQEKDEKIRDV